MSAHLGADSSENRVYVFTHRIYRKVSFTKVVQFCLMILSPFLVHGEKINGNVGNYVECRRYLPLVLTDINPVMDAEMQLQVFNHRWLSNRFLKKTF